MQAGYSGAEKETHVFTKRLERGIQQLAAGLSSSKAGALIQVWMPEVYSSDRVVLSTEGLPFSISGVGDLLALFRCISCKYRFDTEPQYGESMGAIGRVYHYGKPEMCLDVQQYDKDAYLRITEAQLCRIHSTLILPVFDRNDSHPMAVVEVSHHDKGAEVTGVLQLFMNALQDVGLRTTQVNVDELKLGLRKWPVDVCSVPSNSIKDSDFMKKIPDEQIISHQHRLGKAMQTGFGHVSDFLMNMGMESLVINPSASYFHSDHSDQQQNSATDDLTRASIPTDGPSSLMRCISETGYAHIPQSPEKHPCSTQEASSIFPASQSMADEADGCKMLCDSPKQEDARSSTDTSKDDDDDNTEARKKENRLGGGAGKRLTYRDLEAHFGHGLKDAARRLGICPTTLKRACRRNGITRWPSRQISKLIKVWKQMGYKGEPPTWLLQNAISGNLRSENLAYVLSAGLHMGLNPQRYDCLNEKEKLMLHRANVEPNGHCLMTGNGMTFKNVTHHGAFTAALNGPEDDTFGYGEDQRDNHNHTWHAGTMANVLLHPCSFACPSTMAVSTPLMNFELENKSRSDAISAFDLERTQRGGSGMIPMLSELTPIEDDVLLQSYQLPLAIETQNLFH